MALTSERPYRPHRQSPDSAIILIRIGQFKIILCKERFPIKKISETTVPPNGEFPPVAVYEYVQFLTYSVIETDYGPPGPPQAHVRALDQLPGRQPRLILADLVTLPR